MVKWTDEEITFLKKKYRALSIPELIVRLDRSSQSIRNKACKLGLKSSRWWTDEEIAFLKDNWAYLWSWQVAAIIGRPAGSTAVMANKLKIKAPTKGWRMRPENKRALVAGKIGVAELPTDYDVIKDGKKICILCRTTKTLAQFDKSDLCLSGYRNVCQKCGTERTNASHRVKYWEKKKAGVCSRCGKLPLVSGTSICKNCQDWYRKETRKNYPNRARRLKRETFEAYGGVECLCCGIIDLAVLNLDHIAEDGAKWRKENNVATGHATYSFLKKHDYPSGFQVLCGNCNWSKHLNKGEFCDLHNVWLG
jgi:hypothetical protein